MQSQNHHPHQTTLWHKGFYKYHWIVIPIQNSNSLFPHIPSKVNWTCVSPSTPMMMTMNSIWAMALSALFRTPLAHHHLTSVPQEKLCTHHRAIISMVLNAQKCSVPQLDKMYAWLEAGAAVKPSVVGWPALILKGKGHCWMFWGMCIIKFFKLQST